MDRLTMADHVSPVINSGKANDTVESRETQRLTPAYSSPNDTHSTEDMQHEDELHRPLTLAGIPLSILGEPQV